MANKWPTVVNGIPKAEHSRLHRRIISRYGLASKCESLDCTHKNAKRFEWALKKGRQYSDNPDDYIQLCCSCHRKYDFNEEIRTKLKRKKLGDLHNKSKLTNAQVMDIKVLILSGEMSDKIADTYGVHPTTISNIKTGKTWNYLTKMKKT